MDETAIRDRSDVVCRRSLTWASRTRATRSCRSAALFFLICLPAYPGAQSAQSEPTRTDVLRACADAAREKQLAGAEHTAFMRSCLPSVETKAQKRFVSSPSQPADRQDGGVGVPQSDER